MKQLKIVLIVLGIFLTGFGAGFFTHRHLVGRQLERVRDLGRGPGFSKQLLKTIDATPEQVEQLRPILRKYGETMAQETRRSRQQRRATVDSLHEEIKPYLTPAQIQELESLTHRFRGKDKRKPRPGREKEEE